MLAARNPHMVNKLILLGSKAYIAAEDQKLIDGLYPEETDTGLASAYVLNAVFYKLKWLLFLFKTSAISRIFLK